MSPMQVLLLILILTLAGEQSHSSMCKELFPAFKHTASGRFYKRERGRHYTKDGFFATRVRTFSEDSKLVHVIKNSRFEERNHKIYTRDPKWKTRHQLKESQIRELADEIAEFLMRQYPRRGWPKDFIKKVADNIVEYFYQSDFILIRNSITGELEGTMRIINSPFLVIDKTNNTMRAPRGPKPLDLPVEKEFSINLKSTSLTDYRYGAVYEVSSFAIEKVPDRLHVVGLMQKYLIYTMYQPTIERYSLYYALTANTKDDVVFAYGDRLGQAMYHPYGFEKKPDAEKIILSSLWSVISGGQDMLAQVSKKYDLRRYGRQALDLVKLELNMNPVFGGIMYDEGLGRGRATVDGWGNAVLLDHLPSLYYFNRSNRLSNFLGLKFSEIN